MIKDSPIVEEIRRIRCVLSAQIDRDVDKFMDYVTKGTSAQTDHVKLRPESPPNEAQDMNGKGLLIGVIVI